MISNDSIKEAIRILNEKVKVLKDKDPNNKVFPLLLRFYQRDFTDWLEPEMDHKEIDERYNENIMNNILDWITTINKILQK